MSAAPDLDVLHCCNHVLCVAKPAGMATVPDASGDESLLDRSRAWIKREFDKPGAVFLGVVHRLDRPVSGVVCFGRTSKGAARLTASFRDRATEKSYVAVLERDPGFDRRDVEQWLLKDERRNVVSVVPEATPGARRALTEVRVLARARGRCLVGLRPVTGRPHQLRVAVSTLGAPIVGDLKYGADAPLEDRSVALHALRLRVPHPTRDEVVDVRARPPALDVWRGWDALELD
ncbi:MAG: RNA pseudouridine synthase [Planctomycetota bacterium]